MLGKSPASTNPVTGVSNEETLMKALIAALSGDLLPSWNGPVESLRAWLRQLSLWELDNDLPKSRCGLKLLRSFSEGSAPRKIAETIDIPTLTSDAGYGTILSAILAKYSPFVEAAGPAAVETFVYGCERARNESFSTYVAAKEVALQEMEAHLGERLPTKIAGRILLRHAGLNDTQREAMAVKYNSMLTFEQVANTLRPLDRPEALVTKVAKTYAAVKIETEAENEDEAEGEDDEEELQPDEEDSAMGMETWRTWCLTPMRSSRKRKQPTSMPTTRHTKLWDVNFKREGKGRQFFKPRGAVIKKGKNEGHKGQSKGKGSSNSFRSDQGRGKPPGTPEELMAKTRCFSCGQLGHMSRECPNRREEAASNFFVCQGSSGVENRTYVTDQSPPLTMPTFLETKNKSSLSMLEFKHVGTMQWWILQLKKLSLVQLLWCDWGNSLRVGDCSQRRLQVLRWHALALVAAPRLLKFSTFFLVLRKAIGLLRVTEISDAGAFKTSFLLPISYIELVGATIDTNNEQFMLRNGRTLQWNEFHQDTARSQFWFSEMENGMCLSSLVKSWTWKMATLLLWRRSTCERMSLFNNNNNNQVLRCGWKQMTVCSTLELWRVAAPLWWTQKTFLCFGDFNFENIQGWQWLHFQICLQHLLCRYVIHGNNPNSPNFLFGRVMCFLSNCRSLALHAIHLEVFALLALLWTKLNHVFPVLAVNLKQNVWLVARPRPMQRRQCPMPCRTQGSSLRMTSSMLQFIVMSNMFILQMFQRMFNVSV